MLIKAAVPLTTSDTKTVSEWTKQMATLPQASNLATRILLLTLLFEVHGLLHTSSLFIYTLSSKSTGGSVLTRKYTHCTALMEMCRALFHRSWNSHVLGWWRAVVSWLCWLSCWRWCSPVCKLPKSRRTSKHPSESLSFPCLHDWSVCAQTSTFLERSADPSMFETE